MNHIFKFSIIILSSFVFGIISRYLLSEKSTHQQIPNKETTNINKTKRSSNWEKLKIDLNPSQEKENKQVDEILNRLEKGVLPQDWISELRKILELTSWQNSGQRRKILKVFFSQWANVDLDAALNMAGKIGPDSTKIKEEILSRLAQKDYKAALDYYELHQNALRRNPNLNESFLKEIIKNWSLSAPQETFEWCNTLNHPESSKDKLLLVFMENIIRKNTPGEIALYMDKIKSRNDSIPYGIIENWADVDPEQTLKWIGTIKDKNYYYMQQAIEGIAKKDLEKAEKLLETLPQWEKNSTVAKIAQKMQYAQGEEASLNWTINQIPLSDIDLLSLIPVSRWTSGHPQAALEWVKKLPSSPGKDKAIYLFSRNLSGNSNYFEQALDLIHTMENPKNKKEVMESTLKSWKEAHPADFEKWSREPKNASRVKEQTI